MNIYDWPTDLHVSNFSLSLRRNTRSFSSPYNGTNQTIELGGERWVASVSTVPTDRRSAISRRREVLSDRLSGGVNAVRLWHFFNPVAGGTFTAAPVAFPITKSGAAFPITKSGAAFPITRGALYLETAVPAGANTCTITSVPGRTVLAGSMVSINGQLVRVEDDVTADSAGRLLLTFAPRARVPWPAYGAPIVTSNATAIFKLQGEAPIQWGAGLVSSTSFDLVEEINL